MTSRQSTISNPVRNAFTVDVEDYFQVEAFSSVVSRNEWDSYSSRVGANTRQLLELLDHHGVKATFFVLGWVAERQPQLVHDIHSAGHEIASHGYSHRLVYMQSPAEFREETYRAKCILEGIVQKPVIGYRAATYSITGRSMWALDVLAELGFEYDSSIFPIRHDRYGIPGFPRYPHKLMTQGGREITEFPLSTSEFLGRRLPVAGGGYFRLYPYALTRSALYGINRSDRRPFIFYIHPWEIDTSQPRIAGSVFSRFRHYNNLHRCRARLNKLLSDFRFTTVHNVLQELTLP